MTPRLFTFVPVVVLLSTSLLLQGCSGTKVETKDSAEQQARSDAKNQQTEAERCRSKLSAAILRVAPATLAMQDKPEGAINGLNAWIASCAAGEVDQLQLTESTIALISDSARTSAKRFTVNDAGYIRDCILLRDLSSSLFNRSEAVDGTATLDADRVVTIFDWLIRNVSLLNTNEARIPLGACDVLMTGRGTVEDRAWLFAEALRQQQIDAVVVRTAAEKEEGGSLASATWLVAVCMEGTSLVFDTSVGLPVTANDEVYTAGAPIAGIDVLRNHARWKDSTAEIIAQLTAFSPRMLVLQEQLAAEDAAILYEELTGGVSEILPLITRITESSGGLWPKEKISVWSYPEAQIVAANARTEQQDQEYDSLMRPFEGPFQRTPYQSESLEELTTVPEELKSAERAELVQQRLLQDYARILGSSEDMFGKPSRQLLKTRLEQILGKTDTSVIQRLQQVRIASMEEDISVRIPQMIQERDGLPEIIKIPFPKMILEVNQSTTGDSLYWTAMCQMDRDEYGAAITTLMNYRRQYPEGKWKYPSLMNHALCLMQQKRTTDALSVLEEANQESNPERQRARLLTKALPQ